jgi:hypothetical protein
MGKGPIQGNSHGMADEMAQGGWLSRTPVGRGAVRNHFSLQTSNIIGGSVASEKNAYK